MTSKIPTNSFALWVPRIEKWIHDYSAEPIVPSTMGIVCLPEVPLTVRAAMKTKNQNKLKSVPDLTIVLSQCIKPRFSEI